MQKTVRVTLTNHIAIIYWQRLLINHIAIIYRQSLLINHIAIIYPEFVHVPATLPVCAHTQGSSRYGKHNITPYILLLSCNVIWDGALC